MLPAWVWEYAWLIGVIDEIAMSIAVVVMSVLSYLQGRRSSREIVDAIRGRKSDMSDIQMVTIPSPQGNSEVCVIIPDDPGVVSVSLSDTTPFVRKDNQIIDGTEYSVWVLDSEGRE